MFVCLCVYVHVYFCVRQCFIYVLLVHTDVLQNVHFIGGQ